jgi:hypothetical protein
MANDKCSMTNSQFRLIPLVAAGRAGKSVVQFLWLRLGALGSVLVIVSKSLSPVRLPFRHSGNRSCRRGILPEPGLRHKGGEFAVVPLSSVESSLRLDLGAQRRHCKIE